MSEHTKECGHGFEVVTQYCYRCKIEQLDSQLTAQKAVNAELVQENETAIKTLAILCNIFPDVKRVVEAAKSKSRELVG